MDVPWMRHLGDAVHRARRGQTGRVEDRGHEVDDVVELGADLATGGDPARPVDDHAVARAAPVRGDLLGPLVGRVHRMRPADREVVIRRWRAEVVDVRGHELGGLEGRRAVEQEHLVERPVQRPLAGRAVVPDDVEHERVVEDAQVHDGVDEPSDVVVDVLQEARVDLHLAREDRLERVRHRVPGRDLGGPRGELRLGRHDPQLLLAGEHPVAQGVPAVIEAALVPVAPLGGHVVGRMGGAGREVGEERLVGRERMCLPDPGDGVVGEVLGEVVALLRGLLGLDRRRAAVQRGVVLVRLAADEAVEVLEAAATGRPGVERPDRARLPDRHLVALAELRRAVPVEAQDLGDGRRRLRPDRRVPGSGRGDLGHGAHAHRVVVAAGE